MPRPSSLSVLLVLASPLALAAEPSPPGSVEALVRARLVTPLAAHEARRSAFSRARPPPTARRIRLPGGESPVRDEQGRAFVAFAVDVRRGWVDDGLELEERWRRDDVTGCVYPQSGEVFVLVGTSHRPAEVLWGKRVQPRADVCRAAPGRS